MGDAPPWATAYESGPQPRLLGRPDVVVETVTHVQDGLGRASRLRHDAFEEGASRLLDPPSVGRADDVHGQAEGAQDQLRPGGLVAGQADAQPHRPELGEAGTGVGVEVLLAERLRLPLPGTP